MGAFKKNSPGCCGCPAPVPTVLCDGNPVPSVVTLTDPLGNTCTLSTSSSSTPDWGGSQGAPIDFTSPIVASGPTGCAQVTAPARVYYKLRCATTCPAPRPYLQQIANMYFCSAPNRWLNAKYPDMWSGYNPNFTYSWPPTTVSFSPFLAVYDVPVTASSALCGNPNQPTPLSGRYTVSA